METFNLNINYPSNITMVTGNPGVGKTTFVLKTLPDVANALYISYNEPFSSLQQKLRRVRGEESPKLKTISGISGGGSTLNMMTSEILKVLERGGTAIVDSIDALLSSIDDDPENRPLLQLLYNATKANKGSLILISENSQHFAAKLEYTSDIIIDLEVNELNGAPIRSITIKKDRDHKVVKPRYHLTLENECTVFNGSIFLDGLKDIRGMVPTHFPTDLDILSGNTFSGRVMVILDDNTPVKFNYMMRMIYLAHYILNGYQVLLYLRPDEDNASVIEDIRNLTAIDNPELVVFKTSEEAENKKAIGSYEEILSKKRTLHIYDSLSNEALYMKDPILYEDVVRRFTGAQSRQKATVIGFLYEHYQSMNVQRKYANIIYKVFSDLDDVFMKGLRPWTNPYHVTLTQVDGKAQMEFTEVS